MRAIRLSSAAIALLSLCALLDLAHASPSTDSPVPLGPYRGWIGSLALSPDFASDGRVWAAAFGGRIFASTTHGGSWFPSHEGETDPIVTGIAVSPDLAGDHTVYAAADDGVFRSTDSGESWTNTSSGLGGHYCRTLVLSPRFATDHTAYVSTDVGVYASRNGGTSWQRPMTAGSSLLSLGIVADGQHPDMLFGGVSGGGIVSSDDAGITWNHVPGFPTARTALAIAISPTFSLDKTILAGTDDGVWSSRDRGATWDRAGLVGQRVPAVVLSAHFASDRIAFAGSASGTGVWLSRDGGLNWNTFSPAGTYVESLAISPTFSADHTIIAGLAGAGIIISDDGGQTWRPSNSGLHAAEIAQMRASSGRVGVAGNGGASFLGEDGGVWSDYLLPTPYPTAYDASASDIYVGTQGSGLWVSRDDGATWSTAELPSAPVSAIGLSPTYATDGSALVAAGYVYRSQDGGHTWRQSTGILGNDVRRFGFSPTFPLDHVVFAATVNHGVLRSLDGGLTWAGASSGLPSDQISEVLLARTYQEDRTAFAATAGDGVYRTENGGLSWARMPVQPPVGVVVALAWDVDASLLAGSEKGVYRYDGHAWLSLTPGWDAYVTDLAIQGDNLYISTLGDGVWKLSRPRPAPTVTSTLVPTAVVSIATLTPTPVSTIRATPILRPTGHRLNPHVNVYPKPLLAGHPGLILVRGPGNGTIRIALAGPTWNRTFHARLGPDGKTAFGFVAPAARFSLIAIVHGNTQSAKVSMTVPVVESSPPPPP